MSLNTRMTLLVAIFVVAIGGVIGSTLWVSQSQKVDGLVINLAGRQRMLTQKMTKATLGYVMELRVATAENDSAEFKETSEMANHKAEAIAASKLFANTLNSLTSGGGVSYEQENLSLPSCENQEIKSQLAVVEGMWGDFSKSINTIVNSRSQDSSEFQAALALVLSQNGKLLSEMNTAVGMFQAESDSRVSLLMGIQYVAGVLSVVVFAAIVLYIRRWITSPLKDALRVAQAVALGDLTQTCSVTTGDEVGQLSHALNEMCVNLKQIISRIIGGASEVAASATQLLDTSSQLTTGAQDTSDQSATVSAAAEEMAVSMKTMATSSEEMSQNVKTVASAVEEMTATAGEIAKSADQAASVADQAATLAKTSNDNIGQLGAAAEAIGKVIETIQDIAEQTNLLALNATIEAARAGEAGKGFAVVANEVKELAKQTAEATEDIRQRIEGIQQSTGSAVTSIEQVSEVIGKVNEVSRTIAAAVDEQSITTREIAQNITQTASAAETVSSNVAETVVVTQEITQSIARVDNTARQTTQSAQATEMSGRQLSTLAATLQVATGEFELGKDVRVDAANLKRITWDPRTMATTVDLVDEQHQTLFAKLNELLEATEQGTGKEKIGEMLEFLGDYTRKHFADEEKIMAEKKCPVEEQNKKLHKAFLEEYGRLMERYQKEGPTNEFLIDVQQRVCVWLAKHIKAIDTQLKNC